MAKPEQPKGRPRSAEPQTTICTWMPASYHDRLIKMANARNESVSSLVRTLLVKHLRERP